MKLVVSGSRWIEDYGVVAKAIAESGFVPTLIIEGGQRRWNADRTRIVGGVDYLARQWAEAHGIDCVTFDADWKAHGKSAGPIRNRKQAEAGDALVAIPDGRSTGTRDMINAMRGRGKPVYIKEL